MPSAAEFLNSQDEEPVTPDKLTFYYPETPEATEAAGLSYSMEGGIHGAGEFSDVDLREHALEDYDPDDPDSVVAVAMRGAPTGAKFPLNIGGRNVTAWDVDTGGGLTEGQVDVATRDPEKAKHGLSRSGISASAFLHEEAEEPAQSAMAFLQSGDDKPTLSRMPTEKEAQFAPHAVPASSLASQMVDAFQKKNYQHSIDLLDTLVQRGIRRTLNLPVDRPPTQDELKDTATKAMAELTQPPPGREFRQPEFIDEYYGEHPDTLLKVGGKAISQMPVDVANFMLSPAGAATPMAGALSKTAQAMISAGFSVQQVWDALHTDDPVSALKNVIFAVAGAQGAREGFRKAPEPEEAASGSSDTTGRTKQAGEAVAAQETGYQKMSDRDLVILAGDTTQPQEVIDAATAEMNRRAAEPKTGGIGDKPIPDLSEKDLRIIVDDPGRSQIEKDLALNELEHRAGQPVASVTQKYEKPSGPQILSPEERSAKIAQGKAIAREARLSTTAAQTMQAIARHQELLTEGQALGEQISNLKKQGLSEAQMPRTIIERRDAINQMLRDGYNRETADALAQKDLNDEVSEIVDEERSKSPRPKRESTSLKRTPPKEKPKVKTVKQQVDASQPKRELISGTKVARESRLRELGLAQVEEEARQAWGSAWDKAAEEEEVDPGIAERLANEINNDPRAANPTEHSLLIRNAIASEESHARAVDAVNSAKTPAEKLRADERMSQARDRVQIAYDAIAKSGSERGRSLNIMKMVADRYYNLPRMEAERRAAKGIPLTAGELAETKSIFDNMKKVREALTEVDKQRKMDNQFARAAASTVMDMAQAPKGKRGLVEWIEGHEAKARESIIKRRGRLNIGFDPQALTDEIIIGAAHVIRGLERFEDWSEKMVDEFGNRIKPHLRDIYDRSLAMIDAARERAKDLANLQRATNRKIMDMTKLMQKIDAGDVSRIIRKKLPYDQRYFELNQEHQALKRQHDRMVAKDRQAKQPGWRKFSDWMVAFWRAIKLTGLTTYLKIFSAGVERIPQAMAENIVGSTITRLTLETLTGGRGETVRNQAMFNRGFSPTAEWARLKGYPGGFKDIPGVLSGRIPTKETLLPTPWYLDLPGRTHAAGKRPTWRSSYDAGKVLIEQHAQRLGKDLNDPKVKEDNHIAARAYADRQIFLQDNVAAEWFNIGNRWLESSKKFPTSGFVLSRLARILLPIVRVPTNVAFEAAGMLPGVGPLLATGKLMRVMQRGLHTIKPEEADFIMRHYNKGFVGAALFFTGYLNPDAFGGFYLPGEKRKPGSLHWGDMNVLGVRIPWYILHAPPFLVMQAGATARKLMNAKRGAYAATLGTLNGLAEEIPFVRETSIIDSMLGEGWKNSKALGQFIAGLTSPMLVQNIAQWTDERDKFGAPVRRYPKTPLDYVKLAFPGLREQVPKFPSSSRPLGKKQQSGMFTIPTRQKQNTGMFTQHL